MGAIEPFGVRGNFYEGPRWRDSRWWVSDTRGGIVRSFSESGEATDELTIDDHPSGLGWMPDGSLLVVSMRKRKLLRVRPGRKEPEVHADLASLCGDKEGFLNDMAVDAEGRAYVGFDPDFSLYGSECDGGRVLSVDPDGTARVAGDGLLFPNGMVILDGQRLIVAETCGSRFSSFPIEAAGALGARSVWADVSGKVDRRPDRTIPLGSEPFGLDGCDLDAAGHIWAADWRTNCFRFAPDGAIVDEIVLPQPFSAWACALGGADGRTLIICAADRNTETRSVERKAVLFTTKVDVPGARWNF